MESLYTVASSKLNQLRIHQYGILGMEMVFRSAQGRGKAGQNRGEE